MMKYNWMNLVPTPIRGRLEGRVRLIQTFKNMGWLFFDRVFRLGIGLIVGVLVARYLGPEQFGALNYASALVALFQPLVSLGLDNIVIRDIVKEPASTSKLLGTTFLLKLSGSLLLLFLVIILSLLINTGDGVKFWLVLVIASGTLFQAFDSIDLWFQSQLQSKYTVFARNTAYLTMAGVRIALILLKAPLLAFCVVSMLELLLAAVGLIIAYYKLGEHITKWSASLSWAKYLLKSSGFLIISGVAVSIYMKIDQVMLETMSGSKEVGIYAAAVRISEIWYFIPMAILNSVFPTIIATKQISEDLYYSRIYKFFKWMCLMAYIMAIIVTFSSDWLIWLLFGAGYAGAGPVLALHIWSGVFVVLGVAQTPWDITENLTRLTFWRTLSSAALNVLLNLWLIPAYQSLGAAIATIIAYAASGYLLNAFSRKTWPIFILQTKALFLLPSKKLKT
jgi:PST family polysaccharide transporter